GSYIVNGMFHDVSIIPHIAALWFLLLGILENLDVHRTRASFARDDFPEQQNSRRPLAA
ncbi:unnamed protein product, partial [marine sediment metagenome]